MRVGRAPSPAPRAAAADRASPPPSPPRSFGHDDDDDGASSPGSEGSWRDLSDNEVLAILTTPFRVGKDTLQGFERRLTRARVVLALREIPASAEDAALAIQVARYVEYYSQQGGLQAINAAMEGVLDRDDEQDELPALLAAANLLGSGARPAHRPQPTAKPEEIRPSTHARGHLGPRSFGDLLGRPALPKSSSPPRRDDSRWVKNLAAGFDDARSDGFDDARSERSMVTELVRELRNETRTKSTIQIKPEITWPSLADVDQDIEDSSRNSKTSVVWPTMPPG